MATVYEVRACAEQGHVRHGVGNGTNPENVLWADYCLRCDADLRSDKKQS